MILQDQVENDAQAANSQTITPTDSKIPSDGGSLTPTGSTSSQMKLSDLIEDYDASEGSIEVAPDPDLLTLADVVASVYRSYPDILRSQQERSIANGQLIESWGAFDTKLDGYTISEPTGFYENYRNGIGVARQTWWGGYVSAGYRIGRGSFQPWYKERQTDDAGEFKLGVVQPLLRGRSIDPSRVAIFQASLAQQAADPLVQLTILQVARDASMVYWQWVAMGNVLEAQRELLELAIERGKQFEVGFQAGKFAEIDLILNQQLIAERQAKLLMIEQKFRSISFKLGLFLRTDSGQPMVPSDDWLPERFPIIELPRLDNFDADLQSSLSRRPETQLLSIEYRQMELERRLACNDMLPNLDFISEMSQDMGEPASKSDDKGQFELVIGLQGQVPIQRRKARGKLQSTTAKMVQISRKLQLQRDKIGAELRTAYNALQLQTQVVEQSEISLRAAIESLVRYRFAFDRGKIDLIYLNLLETKANETEIKLVEAQQAWFAALAEMQVVMALDPLDQAMIVSSLPLSDRPGPGHLPEVDNETINRLKAESEENSDSEDSEVNEN